jgi:hypothetical protein
MLKGKIIKRSVKMQIYKTLIRPTVTYGSETWTLTKSTENLLRIFERKILRKIYGPIQEGDPWRIRNNEELNRSINGEDIVKFIKPQRIRWLGHVKRMEVGAMPRKIMERRLFIGRRKGRPRLRWMDDVVADLKVIKMEKTKDSNGDWSLRRLRLPKAVVPRGWMDELYYLGSHKPEMTEKNNETPVKITGNI